MRVIPAIGAGIIVAALIAATYLPITKHEGLRVCLQCGLNRQDRVVLGIRRSTLSGTPFTQWYYRRIGLSHEHQWKEDESGAVQGENLWGKRWIITQYECGSDGIASDYKNIGLRLLRMEPLNLDVDLWKEVTHRDENRATEARSVARSLEVGSDAQVTYAWSLAKQYLEDRAAWKEGFNTYWGSKAKADEVTAPAASNP